VHAHTRSASAQLVARHLTPHPSTGTALVLPLEGGPGVRVPIAGTRWSLDECCFKTEVCAVLHLRV
jgi:hypothetical protein